MSSWEIDEYDTLQISSFFFISVLPGLLMEKIVEWSIPSSSFEFRIVLLNWLPTKDRGQSTLLFKLLDRSEEMDSCLSQGH